MAVQGIGFGARRTALQGFGAPAPQAAIPIAPRPRAARRRDRDEEALLFMLLR